MKYWEFKKANFKVGGITAYEGYLMGEFQGYYHKKRNYRLVSKTSVDGSIKHTEKFVGWGWDIFNRDKDKTWEEFKKFFLEVENNC